MKVALVCDWLAGTGGAERVVLELHKLYPGAPIYTSQYNKNSKKWYGHEWFADADIRTTWLQKLPKGLRKFSPIFRAISFSRLNLDNYDLVISSSGAEAKFIKTKGIHVTYCHAPTHYYWSRYQQYLDNPGLGKLNFLARIGLRLLVRPMRRWDYKAAQRPDFFIANSSYTKEQIKKYYGRDSVVIHPPVDIEHFKKHDKAKHERHGFVIAGRQTPYKRFDLAVRAASKLNVPLTVIGRGPDHRRLKRLAGRSVIFLTKVSDSEMPDRFAEATGFIFPGVDDFGIVAVEAMAAGTPIIAYDAGGALDYVNKNTGLVFEEQTADFLAKTMQEFTKLPFNHERIAKQAEKFSPQVFQSEIKDFIKSVV